MGDEQVEAGKTEKCHLILVQGIVEAVDKDLPRKSLRIEQQAGPSAE